MPIRFTGRAAARFDDAVERAQHSPTSRTSADARADAPTGLDAELLELVSALRSVPLVEPSPAYAASLRERLMDEADRLAAVRADDAAAVVRPGAPEGAEDRLRLPVRTPRRRLTLAAGTLAALGVSASVGVAAQSALPGEPLYPVKRALEAAQTRVAPDDVSRAELLMDSASDRLGEAGALLAEGDADPESAARLTGTLDTFSEQADEAAVLLLDEYARTGDRGLVTDLRTFTATSGATLADLEPPDEDSRAAWQRALDVVAAIDTDALTACPLCSADLAAFTSPLPRATPDFGDAAGRPAAERLSEGVGSDEAARPRRGGDRGGPTDSDPTGAVPTDVPSTPGTDVPSAPGGSGTGGATGGTGGGLDGATGGLPGVDGVTGGVTGDLTDTVGGIRGALPGGGDGRGKGGNGGGKRGGTGGGTGDVTDGLDDLLP